MPIWTLPHAVTQPIRHSCQTASGGSFVAILTLHLAPCHDQPGVRFSSHVHDPEAQAYVPAVEEGIAAFVIQRAQAGHPVGYLHVTLTHMGIHPTDAKASAFRRAALMAMETAFTQHETVMSVAAQD